MIQPFGPHSTRRGYNNQNCKYKVEGKNTFFDSSRHIVGNAKLCFVALGLARQHCTVADWKASGVEG